MSTLKIENLHVCIDNKDNLSFISNTLDSYIVVALYICSVKYKELTINSLSLFSNKRILKFLLLLLTGNCICLDMCLGIISYPSLSKIENTSSFSNSINKIPTCVILGNVILIC